MDPRHRVQWPDLTGREQYEWFECWERAGRTHLRMANATRGLRGTDLDRLTTVHNVQAAMANSPSLATRRPAQHRINEDDWANAANAADVARQLF